MDILKTINAQYLIDIYKDSMSNLITKELILYAQNKVNNNFSEYIKSNPLEESIKLAGLQYFVAIYLLIISKDKVNTNKESLKKLVSEKNKVEDLSKSLLNFDFYLGSCGIDAQDLAIDNKI